MRFSRSNRGDIIGWDLPTKTPLSCMSSCVSAFLRGKFERKEFEVYLVNSGYKVTAEVDQLIRNHEADNGGKFSEFWSALSKQHNSIGGKSDSEAVGFHFDGEELLWNVPDPVKWGRKNLNSAPNILSWSYSVSCRVFRPIISSRWVLSIRPRHL
jgi:hypothetical protein